MQSPADGVRPTRRCLADLEIAVPDLGTLLSALPHPLIERAQAVPKLVAAGGAERVVALTDRVWFKAKTQRWRGVVSEVDPSTLSNDIHNRWWIGAAGLRREDSPQDDFYARLQAECAKGSDGLLPTAWDIKRLIAEMAQFATRIMRHTTRLAAAQSLLDGDAVGFVVGDRDVRVRIRVMSDGQAYLAIGATGSVDAKFFVTLISSFPEVPHEHWLPEPHDASGLEIALAPGEVLWSAMLPPDAQRALIAELDEEFGRS